VRVFQTLAVRYGRAKWFLGAESFNLPNHTNIPRANPYVGSGHGGAIDSLPARQIQLFTVFEF
jgi:hypothetical protein